VLALVLSAPFTAAAQPRPGDPPPPPPTAAPGPPAVPPATAAPIPVAPPPATAPPATAPPTLVPAPPPVALPPAGTAAPPPAPSLPQAAPGLPQSASTLPQAAPLLPMAATPTATTAPFAGIRLDPPGPRFPVEPWSDDDITPRNRYAIGDFGVSLAAEYRANGLVINPISLNTNTFRNASWIEHRLRLDLTLDWQDKVRIYLSTDVLDGALWGDNGDFGGTPGSNAGIGASAKNPNVTRPCVALAGDGDPLDPTSYGYTLCEQDAVRVRTLYTHISTPVGALRIGRQSIIAGAGVQANDGEGRTNRFGFSRTGNVVDRILFATKPLEAFKPKNERNLTESEGLIVATGYDRLVTDSPQLWSDDVGQWFTALIFRAPEHPLGKELFATAFHVHRWNPQNGTSINAIGLRAMSQLPGNFTAGFDVTYNVGSTREVAEAYKLITNDPVVDQAINQFGARAVLKYDIPWFSAYLELDYATGDSDPNTRTPLTQFTFAEDSNVGLLLFEHTLAFQTARAAAAGVETLRRLGAKSYPAEVIHTRGAFTNAIALFPQVDFRPLPELLIRGGVLMAWAESPVIDQVASLQARDGLTIEDDLVNFVGGPSKQNSYYGTELDLRIRYRLLDHVNFDLEGAVLFPGDALQNRQGEAVRSVLVQGRTTAFF